MMLIRLAILVIVVDLSVGCAAPTHVMLDRAVIMNETRTRLTDVKVEHLPTHRIGGVSMLLPGHALDLGLPRQPMLADRSIVTWKEGGRRRTAELELPHDAAAARSGATMILLYTLRPDGVAEVSLASAEGL